MEENEREMEEMKKTYEQKLKEAEEKATVSGEGLGQAEEAKRDISGAEIVTTLLI